ncbi:phosphatidylinositol-4- kinase [Exophiala dermatitidis]|uniref:1-phosphatidylinositol 4-kinase n=2 Tax=Exophiala dermatitidis TaxID=5970 RepID=H6BLL7_EXODN|nr:phosphatidylinositol 4-kinase [Exophiala dermatitidis NIH/UT8656]KAJ4514586.1 phosphatidylinositol-4- kinase [Exophiala dermatitidis]EHY51910.1 phosphatidylinositol 4-kinase [Exophiala dermatitidis NIH/UT8656]KAJ4518016.1 phosphatidylinositol-4- kinase [Exophiala dermatitidis]KAJ4520915.1 phosphatidylinositol-4- kinase [Exophiala dermatitidis]KAJ4546064.1 phosphatidylinositol-4- kinase [Exophiala dermatitidis]
MDVSHGSLRRQAFSRLAILSAQRSHTSEADFRRLTSSITPAKSQRNGVLDGVLRAITPTSRTRMTHRELDILLALCASAQELHDLSRAERLADQLSAYLPEAHSQLFIPSPFIHEIRPAPWTALTFQLTKALLLLGLRFPTLKEGIAYSIKSYLQNWTQSAAAVASVGLGDQDEDNEKEAQETAAIVVSLMGFLDAAASHENFWSSYERVELIRTLKNALSGDFLVAVETASSAIRHSASSEPGSREWKSYLRRFAAQGIPVGAMMLQKGFMKLVLACTARMICDERTVQCGDLLDQYIAGTHMKSAREENVTEDMVEYLVNIITDQISTLEDGSDYLQLSSAWQQRLAFSVKAYALEAFLHCMVLDDDLADPEDLFGWLEDAITNQVQMADVELADVVLKSLAVVAQHMPEAVSNFARILLRFIVQGTSSPSAVTMAAHSLSHILRMLSQDAVITTIYSLGNVLSSQTGAEKVHHPFGLSDINGHHGSLSSTAKLRTGSVISLSLSGEEETSLVCGNVAHAIVVIATDSKDSKIMTLVQTMMLQKVGRISLLVDARIIEEAAKLAVHGKDNELKALLRLYARLHEEAILHGNTVIFDAVRKAEEYLALNLDSRSPLFKIYTVQLLERILSKGDVVEGEFKQSAEVEQAAKEIAPLLRPLSILASRKPALTLEATSPEDADILGMVRDVWYNIAVHGITLQSRIGQQFYHELRLLAMNSLPLVDEARAELLEADVELNTVLRRGMSPQHTAEQRKNLIAVIPDRESDIRQLSYQKVVFLNAVFLVESLRATSGSCAEILEYFQDPTTQTSHMGSCLSSVANEIVKRYTQKVVAAREAEFSAPYVSRQMARIFCGCCHRSSKMQEIARIAASHLVALAPSALCQKSALFALLELLSLMWSSCLDAEVEEYEWRSTLTSTRGKVTIELSDDYAFRKHTLNNLHSDARRWLMTVMNVASLDLKGLLQTYLSEFDDTGSYGRVSLGRSFALEIGSVIPAMDHRLNALDRRGESANINMASDFMAQYTTRQEYRFTGIPEHQRAIAHLDNATGRRSSFTRSSPDAASMLLDSLIDLHKRIRQQLSVQMSEVKELLRSAAALLCQSKKSQTAIVYHLVHIPCDVFSKESVKFGISLWLGVIHENPRMEPRILTEIVQAWERTIDRKQGIFSPRFRHPDPFYVKEEFAPSDRAALQRQAQAAHNTISPHFRLMQFFESHFNAIRLGSANTQRTFIRMLERTLRGIVHIEGHPLLREMQFQVVCAALRVLQFSTCLNKLSMWRLKDLVLSAGLHWFSKPPAWSFGGNRLQIKAEIQVMHDVIGLLQNTRNFSSGSSATGRDSSLQKHDLLEALLANEISRLNVWLNPLAHEGHHHFGHHHHQSHSDTQIVGYARAAWFENPSLAIQLLTRFPNEQLRRQVRFLLTNFPEKALHEPNAIDLLLGESLASDLSFQLKYLLYWSPVNPMQAVTYFLPAFGNHPFIIQYAMRALESHSVDVTFFYVPQIVQALRYDTLGYVERYIIETGKFSQLFAHQIIWNMKANAYKDEDSQEPDPIKPTLDKVMDSLISSFSGADRDFYEREFEFFSEVTDISGKLKPYIKKSKPEKKAKIEEELRKIKVEVGVYLPSNPDGIVVGIDRKSGKPLQSHAKAPYMATFRIRKKRDVSGEEMNGIVEAVGKSGGPQATSATHTPSRPQLQRGHSRKNTSIDNSSDNQQLNDSNSDTYEVWQSAIFKVGDDCRQDVLALQMIAAFRGIFNSVGLDVYVFPYRVTATAPGCGVIDVLPNSISRDMLGREAVNGLHDYFVTKYGGEHSVRYQEARSEFVKSMAAYSVISYLLQFKDRHNGNIMVDDKGHILHIDFGFCFDIAPGGVKFERAPFKLTPEMIAVMGGDDPATSQPYRWFEELTIKAFLASRQYCDKLSHIVELMLDSGLPCFKPETMRNFKNRFVLDRSDREAAEFMLACIKKSAANVTTKVYDEFQLLTNGIPY